MTTYFRQTRRARRLLRAVLTSRVAAAGSIGIVLAGGLGGCATLRSIPAAITSSVARQSADGGLFRQSNVPSVPPVPEQMQVPRPGQQGSGVELVSHMVTPDMAGAVAPMPASVGAWPDNGHSCLPAPVCPPLDPQPAPPDPTVQLREKQDELRQTVDRLQDRVDTLESELQSARNTVQDMSISLQTARQELSDLTRDVRYWRREMQQSQAAAAQLHANDIAKLDELSRLLAELSAKTSAEKPATDPAQ